ncbi:gliding motility lipoprotein GldH [Dysgonomonas sp. 216]|uniref:gliding motility lipoprotein GldH n=1 Tax=Dysgonomonas sp. 216 TaxID=2302934 RepID=UPI0013D50D0E|nr:gliding motility lipoprotein GldH [Dysgonomonas sp. 216]NDW19062.1 gliding motility lipoprotein GldH [Dysgonomonas sp. 216]
MNKVTLLIVLLVVLVSGACSDRESYLEYRSIKHYEWSKRDTLTFVVDSSLLQPNSIYNISIEIATNGNYPYQNIWLYVQDNISDTIFESYSKEYQLADEFGAWKGDGFGSVYQLSVTYKNNVRINTMRDYTLKIVHGMRDEPLFGVEKLGVKLEKAFYE